MKHTVEDFKNDELYIRCFSQDEADQLMIILDGYEMRWLSGGLLTDKDNYWDRAKFNTYYCYHNGGVQWGDIEQKNNDDEDPIVIMFRNFIEKSKLNKEKIMEYTIENFKKDAFIINDCKTEEEAQELMRFLHERNIKWGAKGSLLLKTHWKEYRENTYYCHDCNEGLGFGSTQGTGKNYQYSISFRDFINKPKSNKEKVFDMIGVEVEERFNIKNANCNPFYFDKWFDLRNSEYDVVNYMTAPILYENRLEKITKDIREELKEYIDSLSSEAFYRKDFRKSILLSLSDILEQKSSNQHRT